MSIYINDINARSLSIVSEIKNLGIVFNQYLNLIIHVDRINIQAFKHLGFILRHGRNFYQITLNFIILMTFRKGYKVNSSKRSRSGLA